MWKEAAQDHVQNRTHPLYRLCLVKSERMSNEQKHRGHRSEKIKKKRDQVGQDTCFGYPLFLLLTLMLLPEHRSLLSSTVFVLHFSSLSLYPLSSSPSFLVPCSFSSFLRSPFSRVHSMTLSSSVPFVIK